MFDSYSIKKDARTLTKFNFPGVTLIPILRIIVPVVLAVLLFGKAGISLFDYFSEDANLVVEYLNQSHYLTLLIYVNIITPLFNSFTLYWNDNHLLHIINNQSVQVSPLQVLKKSNFKVFIMFIVKTFVANIFITLWTMLLIIPGLIKTYSYLLVPYIAIDQPELGIFATLKESERLMYGQKLATFNLHLSFIFWFISIPLTLGLSGLYVNPYLNLTEAILYNDLKYNHHYTVSYEERIKKFQEEMNKQQNMNQPSANESKEDNDLSIYGAHSMSDIESMDDDNQNTNDEPEIIDAVIKDPNETNDKDDSDDVNA